MNKGRRLISRRTLLQGAAAFAAVPAFAQSSWPDRNIRMIVPYPAGGSTDVLFRILAERLKQEVGSPGTQTLENEVGLVAIQQRQYVDAGPAATDFSNQVSCDFRVADRIDKNKIRRPALEQIG